MGSSNKSFEKIWSLFGFIPSKRKFGIRDCEGEVDPIKTSHVNLLWRKGIPNPVGVVGHDKLLGGAGKRRVCRPVSDTARFKWQEGLLALSISRESIPDSWKGDPGSPVIFVASRHVTEVETVRELYESKQ